MVTLVLLLIAVILLPLAMRALFSLAVLFYSLPISRLVPPVPPFLIKLLVVTVMAAIIIGISHGT